MREGIFLGIGGAQLLLSELDLLCEVDLLRVLQILQPLIERGDLRLCKTEFVREGIFLGISGAQLLLSELDLLCEMGLRRVLQLLEPMTIAKQLRVLAFQTLEFATQLFHQRSMLAARF